MREKGVHSSRKLKMLTAEVDVAISWISLISFTIKKERQN